MAEATSRPRGFIFDVDGTLVDSVDAITESINAALTAFDKPPTDEQTVARLLGIPLARKFVELVGDLDDDEAARFCRIHHDHYRQICAGATDLLPGVESALIHLAAESIPMGIATTKTREFTKLILDHLGCARFFAAIVGSEDVENPKPDAEPLDKAAAAMGLTAADCVYVGDTPIDIEAAHAAGTKCIAVPTGAFSGAELESAGADWLLDGVGDIPLWLKRLTAL
jgi:phosphoglycolate phosphatase